MADLSESGMDEMPDADNSTELTTDLVDETKAVSVIDRQAISDEAKALLSNLNSDPYDEDQVELRFLHSKPTCFIILGKPGVGKTTLATKLSQYWGCILVNAQQVLQEAIELQTEIGVRIQEILLRGEAVSEEMTAKMIEEKINSPEVAHHGYVLEDFPSINEDYLSIRNQLELIVNWKMKPDFIINLKIPDGDLVTRRCGQKIDPETGDIYTMEVYNPEKKVVPPKEDEGDEEAEDEEAEEEVEPTIDEEMLLPQLEPEVLSRLIVRPEDTFQQVQHGIIQYKHNMLLALEDYMADHDQQFLLELDANKPAVLIFRELCARLSCFVLRPAAVPLRLHEGEDDELAEDMEAEDLLRTLAARRMLAPRYRWRRSRWLRTCPVALSQGNLMPGKPEYAVSFLDKMYMMSDDLSMAQFLKNPRPFLLPPQPRPPCKLIVVGPAHSGKTTLCHLLALKYNAKVLNMEELCQPTLTAERNRHIEAARLEAVERAIITVTNKLKEEAEAEQRRLEAEAAEKARLEAEEAAAAAAAAAAEAAEAGEAAEPGEQQEEQATEDVAAAPTTDAGTIDQDTAADAETKTVTETPSGEEISIPVPPITRPADIEVTSSHPDVAAIVSEAMRVAGTEPIALTPEMYIDVLEEAILKVEKEMRDENPNGPISGGWILDNFPNQRDQWTVMFERGTVVPDDIICLQDQSEGGEFLLKRWYYVYRNEIDAQIKQRHQNELAAKRAREEAERLRLEEEKRQAEDAAKQAREAEIQARLDAGETLSEIYGEDVEGKADHAATEAQSQPTVEGGEPAAVVETKIEEEGTVVTEDADSERKPDTLTSTVDPSTLTETAVEDTTVDIVPSLPPEELPMAPAGVELDAEKEKRKQYETEWAACLTVIQNSSSAEPIITDVCVQPEETVPKVKPLQEEEILDLVTSQLERNLKYHGWELQGVDIDEEDEDAEADDEFADEAEEEEDANRSIKKPLGSLSHYCPIALKELGVLWPGNPEITAKYRECYYYCATNDNRDKFLADPTSYLPSLRPPKAPATRILILGPHGAGKTVFGRDLAKKLGLFHIQFHERLQELIIAKTKKKVGPEYEEEEDEEQEEEEEDEEVDLVEELVAAAEAEAAAAIVAPEGVELAATSSASIQPVAGTEAAAGAAAADGSTTPGGTAATADAAGAAATDPAATVASAAGTETAASVAGTTAATVGGAGTEVADQPAITVDDGGADKMEDKEVEFTEDEEAIMAYLKEDEPLPVELLDQIVAPWWQKEPFKSTGFILENFPRTVDEVTYMMEAGLFPDTAVILVVEDTDVLGRLLPPKLEKWQQKRARKLARRAKAKERLAKKREIAMAKRRKELEKEIAERKAERKAERLAERGEEEAEEEEEEMEDEEEEEDEESDDIEAILAEEFEEEEEEEDEEEETEEEATDRMRNDLEELYDNDTNRIAAVQEKLEEAMIPRIEIEAGKRQHIVKYHISKALKSVVSNRESLFERVVPVSDTLANTLLASGYKQLSRFGKWCPVKLLEGDCIQPMQGPNFPTYAAIYRQFIYYLSSQAALKQFCYNPLMYLKQPSPKPVVPLRLAVVGPPKSGKTTLCERFVSEFGVQRLSMGVVLRDLIESQPKTELVKKIVKELKKGHTVPDDLAVRALEVRLMDVNCQTRGYVLDGYPVTIKQVKLMTERDIIPVRVIELVTDSLTIVSRATKDRYSPLRVLPLHDSGRILTIRLSAWQREIVDIREHYLMDHANWDLINGNKSKWWLWNEVMNIGKSSIRQIQQYLQRLADGKAASIANLCITQKEFQARLGDFKQYCPVSLALKGELVDCSSLKSLRYAAEFRGHYYKMAGEKELAAFLATPEKFVPPMAPRELPMPHLLPKRVTSADVKAAFPAPIELQGYCPVTFLDGKCRYEALELGNPELAVQYKEKFYYAESEEKLEKFMRLPETYCNLSLPKKLPPKKDPIFTGTLPMLGYMEQTVATAITRALTAAGNVKPKHPFVSVTKSALLYVAFHLKAYNPRSSAYTRNKYRAKLEQFEETSRLTEYLAMNMGRRYKEPQDRPIDFDFKMDKFMQLKKLDVAAANTWVS